jgi:hypothetical protein
MLGLTQADNTKTTVSFIVWRSLAEQFDRSRKVIRLSLPNDYNPNITG